MRITTRLLAVIGSVLFFCLCVIAAQNIENWSSERGMDRLAVDGPPLGMREAIMNLVNDYIVPIVLFMAGPFGLGFVLAAILFSLQDIPAIRKWLAHRWVQRARPKRNEQADVRLAELCEQIADELLQEAAASNRKRLDAHWGDDPVDNTRNRWLEARHEEAQDMERLHRRLMQRLARILTELNRRGVRMDLWDFRLDIYNLTAIAFFLLDLGASLRQGDYLERSFKIDVFRTAGF